MPIQMVNGHHNKNVSGNYFSAIKDFLFKVIGSMDEDYVLPNHLQQCDY